MEIETKNGVFFLEEFHLYETYGGLLAGKITEEFNREIINRDSTEKFKYSPITTISPIESFIKSRLPLHECFAIISSSEIVSDKDANGSLLAVKWYSDMKFDLKAELSQVLSNITWENFAKDFYL